MTSSRSAFDLSHLHEFVGTWAMTGAHALMPGDPIYGESTFERLGDGPVLLQRSRYDHAQIPDSVSVIGAIDGRACMSYFDARGVHRIYDVDSRPGTLSYALNSPGFSQRYIATLNETGDVISATGELCRDGCTWEPDLSLIYRRLP